MTNSKEKTCEVQFETIQEEDTRHDKNLSGDLHYEDVLCISCMDMDVAFHLSNASLGFRWFWTTFDICRPRKTYAYLVSHHNHENHCFWTFNKAFVFLLMSKNQDVINKKS